MLIKWPFNIHACIDPPAFPTHTHGLTEIGLPEFIIDPFTFGPLGNMYIINAAYEFLKKPKNARYLKAILNGKTIKLITKKLSPKHFMNDPYIYWFRKVTSEFDSVKQAYGTLDKDLRPGMLFIHIRVDRDDFVSKDEYYRY